MKSHFYTASVSLLLLCICALPARAEVVVPDQIGVFGKPVMLKARTKGKIFSRGGELVEFSIDGKSLGKNLSGGDGWAFREFVPERRGRYKVTAEYRGDKGEGLFLSLKKGEGIVFIDVEGSMVESPFTLDLREGALEAVKKISRKYPIVFLATGMLGDLVLKKWMREKKIENSPVLPWDSGAVFEDARKKGLGVKAVIGNLSVIDSAREYKPILFSFEDAEGAKKVKSWKEIEKKMK
jgi:hypothetical protein